MNNRYVRLGVALSLGGALLAPVFYFLADSVPLTALAISAIMLGLVCAMLGNARPDISPEASRMMLQTGMENIAALLEELGLRSRAVYVPASGKGNRPRALIPLSDKEFVPGTLSSIPSRLIARYGPRPEDMCLAVTTPGAISVESINVDFEIGPDHIDGMLNQLVVGTMDLADSISVRISADDANLVVVEITKPKLDYDNAWFYRCLGSPLASIAATVVSQALRKPVVIREEKKTRKGVEIHVGVVS